MKSIYADKYQQIGLKIAYYRKLRGLTQEQLAERLELSPAFIGHVEAPNINKAVSLDTLFDVAAALDACTACGVKAIAGKIATGDTFVGDAETKKAIEEKCHPDCVEMEGAAVSQIAGRNGVPCVILRAMSDNADESGYEVLVVKQFSIAEYVKTATEIVAHMIESV